MIHSFNDHTKLFNIISKNGKASYFIPIIMPCLNGVTNHPQNLQKFLIGLTDHVMDRFVGATSSELDAKAIEIISQTICSPDVLNLEQFMDNLAQCYKKRVIDLFSIETSDPFPSNDSNSTSNSLITDV